jgi:lipopolysaccharide heptosyltransferase II
MRIDTQRKIDQILGTFICRVVSFFYYPFSNKTNDAKAEKIVVILLSEMGSLVVSSNMFDDLRARYPNASLYLLTLQRNREVVDLLGHVPVDNLLTINDTSLVTFCLSCIKTLRRLRKERVDSAIDCELFSRISSLLSFLSGAETRVGFHRYTQEGLYRGNFINRRVMYNPYHHISKQFTTLVDAIDSTTTPKVKKLATGDAIYLPELKFSDHDRQHILDRLKIDYGFSANKRMVLLYPSGGLLSIRAWPKEYYVQVGKAFLEKGYAVGVIGLEQDKPLGDLIIRQCNSADCHNLAGYTKTIRELLSILSISSLLITNDGGPSHFAALVRIPTITFFGPETPVLYGSLSPNSVNLFSQLSCSPCITAYNHRSTPCDGDNVCLKLIKPEDVIAQALDLLADV